MRIAIGGGITVPRDVGVHPGGRAAGRLLGVGARAVGSRCAHAARLPGGDDDVDRAGVGHRADRLADAGDAGHDSDDVAVAVRRAVPARPRHQRPAGDGGLARRPLHARRSGRPGRRSRSSAPWRRGDRLSHDGTVYRLPLPDGPGRAIRSMMSPVEVPIYVAALGPTQPRADGRARRRLDRQRLPARARRGLPRPLRAGAAGPAGRSTTSTC